MRGPPACQALLGSVQGVSGGWRVTERGTPALRSSCLAPHCRGAHTVGVFGKATNTCWVRVQAGGWLGGGGSMPGPVVGGACYRDSSWGSRWDWRDPWASMVGGGFPEELCCEQIHLGAGGVWEGDRKAGHLLALKCRTPTWDMVRPRERRLGLASVPCCSFQPRTLFPGSP